MIVTAEIAPTDLAWLDALRRAHYPPERNQLPAHLTMFHSLPASAEREVRSRLARYGRESAPQAMIGGLISLGNGVAFRVISPGLDAIREQAAQDLQGLLSPQDKPGWRAHVTIQNKVSNRQAASLLAALRAEFRPRPLAIRGLGLHRYLGGPWEWVATYAFRGS